MPSSRIRILQPISNDMKKFLYFFGMCAWFVGALGGFGYAAYCKAWFIAVCVLYLGALSFGKVKEFYNKLMESDAPQGRDAKGRFLPKGKK